MRPLFDRYTLLARFLPAALTLLPAGSALVAWFPNRFEGWGLLTGMLTTAGSAMLLAQFGRAGKAKEPQLFTTWGCQPTVAVLRHSGTVLDRHTRRRYHDKLALLVPGVDPPTPESEQIDAVGADQVYLSWVRFLRDNTRDSANFSLVATENANYGFRRNLWGLKPWAIALSALAMAACGLRIWLAVKSGSQPEPAAFVSGFLATLLLAFLLVVVSPQWVRIPAEAYAERLLAACDVLTPAKAPINKPKRQRKEV
jgi:hypothetical protein